MFRFGLRALLSAEPNTEVLGEATDGQEAVTLAASLKPDLILMQIKKTWPNLFINLRRLSLSVTFTSKNP
jgi:DNA-binding NarL/FixJ family response regulator